MGMAITVSASGRVGVTGQLQSAWVVFGGQYFYGNTAPNYFALTLASSGQSIWAKRATDGAGQAAAFDSSGNLITAGWIGGGTLDFGAGPVSLVGGANAFSARYSP